MELGLKIRASVILAGAFLALNILSAAASPNTLSKLATLYANGHPQSQQPGRVLSVAVSDKGLLFASFAAFTNPDGVTPKELHVWSLADASNPQLLSIIDFSQPSPRGQPDDPSFLAPNNLRVIGNHLLFWRDFELYSYAFDGKGNMTLVFQSDFADDLNTGLSLPAYGANYAAAERQLLTNNEFLNLIDRVGFERAQDLISEHVLMNLQNPARPFLIRQTQLAGKNLRIFDPPPNGSFNGLPARFGFEDDFADDLSNMLFMYTQQNRAVHFSAFWVPVLRTVLPRRNLRRTLGQLSNAVLGAVNISKLTKDINARLGNSVKFPAGITLTAQFNATYDQQALLSQLLASFGIQPNDSIELALEKVASSLINQELETALSKLVIGQVLEEWSKVLFGKTPRLARNLANQVDSALQAREKALGFDRYLVNVVMGPLVDLPPVFRLKLGKLVNEIADSEIGQVVTAALTTFNIVIPAREVLTAVGFNVPPCFKIPSNARQFLKLLMTTGGARLDLDNLAFVELLKLYAHYNGDSNYARQIRELRSELSSLHDAISADFSIALLKGLDADVAIGAKFSDILASAQDSIDVRSIVAKAIAASLLEKLAIDQIGATLSVREVLEARGLFIEQARLPFGATLATNAQFSAQLGAANIGSFKAAALIEISTKARAAISVAGQNVLQTELLRAIASLWQRTFGEVSLDTKLEAALGKLISERLDPTVVATFVERVLGELLSGMSESVPLPSLVDNVVRAAQGNCIAQYQVALLGLAAVPAVGELALAAEAALAEAQNFAIKFVVDRLLTGFFSGIFSASAGDYPSWDLKLSTVAIEVPRNQLMRRDVRFADPFLLGNKIGLVQRDIGFNGWIPGFSREVDIVLADPLNLAASIESVALGEWDAVQSVAFSQRGILALAGRRLDSSQFPESALMLVDVLDQSRPAFQLQGQEADALTGIEQLEALTSSRVFVARTIGDQVVLLAPE